jgi:hypothetical protein
MQETNALAYFVKLSWCKQKSLITLTLHYFDKNNKTTDIRSSLLMNEKVLLHCHSWPYHNQNARNKQSSLFVQLSLMDKKVL